MDDYISRDDVLRKFIEGDGNDDERFTEGYNFAVQEYREKVKNMPIADVQPVKHGKWEYVRNVQLSGTIKLCECNICHNKIFGGLSYCGNCGAKMDIIYEDDKIRAIKVIGWDND